MKIFSRLKILFAYGSELDELVKNVRQEKEAEERAARSHHLNLCLMHQQEQNRSHFSKQNCDHCALIEELTRYKRVVGKS